MRKTRTLIVLLVCTAMLTACQSATDEIESGDYFSETEKASSAVFNFLVDKDAEGIKAILCDRLKNVPDIDEQIRNMLDGIDGNLLPVDMDRAQTISKSGGAKENGVYTELYSFGDIQNITSDSGKQYQELLVFYCFVNDESPDVEGVYAISLVENESVFYDVRVPEEEPEVDYGTIYTPDGQSRPATKEEYDAIHAEDASD